MSRLFGRKTPDPEPPATMPDSEDALAMRKRRVDSGALAKSSSSAADRLAPIAGTLGGREYTRSTLGAN